MSSVNAAPPAASKSNRKTQRKPQSSNEFFSPNQIQHELESSLPSSLFTLAKIDASTCLLIAPTLKIVELPAFLLPKTATAGDTISIHVREDVQASFDEAKRFAALQDALCEKYGADPVFPQQLTVKHADPTMLVVEWSHVSSAASRNAPSEQQPFDLRGSKLLSVNALDCDTGRRFDAQNLLYAGSNWLKISLSSSPIPSHVAIEFETTSGTFATAPVSIDAAQMARNASLRVFSLVSCDESNKTQEEALQRLCESVGCTLFHQLQLIDECTSLAVICSPLAAAENDAVKQAASRFSVHLVRFEWFAAFIANKAS